MGRVPGILLLVVLSACSAVSRNALPPADHLGAIALDNPEIRYWGDETQSHWLDAIKPGHEEYRYAGISHREHNYLILSGGGANGAYGAGVLVGWSEQGTRPEFTVVTGVSTGALTAPFAFLGESYDYRLRQLYTETDTEGIYRKRSLLAFLYSDAAMDTTPLNKLIARAVDDEFVQALATEARRGRTLVIGTTNLDAGRPVVWDITKIAVSGHPGSAALIRQVMLASASIPGIFPPVYIQVQTPDGRSYDEMHVDGGASSQFFFYPSEFDWNEVLNRLDVKGTPKIYVIRNGTFRAKYETVEASSLAILGRTANTMIRYQGIGDFFKIWSLAVRDGLETKAAFIRHDVDLGVAPEEVFDPAYMQALFNFGYEQALAGDAFHDFGQLIEGR